MRLLLIMTLICSQYAWAIDSNLLNKNSKIDLPVLLRVYFEQKNELQKLDKISDVWAVNNSQKFATVYIRDIVSLAQIQQLDLTMHVDQKMMEQHASDLHKIAASDDHILGGGIPGYACYSTVEETYQRMDQMATDHPDLVEIIDIGDSWEKTINGAAGYDIRILRITNENIEGDKPKLFLASAIHAREYATAELNTRFAEYLLSQYNQNADVTWILNNHEIHLSLQTNPDGRKQAETGLLWRKNTNHDYCTSNSSSRGADLNRNYSFEWGGENIECSETYGGGSAESEPELMAQMDYIRNNYTDNKGPDINDPVDENTDGIFVDIHSFSELVLFPWGFTGTDSPNDLQFQALGKRTAFFNQYLPEPASDLYPVNGASIDTTYGELGIASLVFELGTSFFQDCTTFENTVLPDNLAALLYLARVTQAPYKQPLGPDIANFTITPNVIVAGDDVQLSGVADDDRYSRANGVQATQTIQTVSAYTNELPINSAAGIAMTASDGTFDHVQEHFNATIDTSGFSTGKNLVYVQAHDGTRAGGTFAEFVDVINPTEVAQLNGQVTDAITGDAVSGGLLQINQSNALSSSDGSYEQWVQPGQADLVVSADGYTSQAIDGLVLTAGQQLTQNIQLQPICTIYHDDMESGVGDWVAEAPWGISAENNTSPANSWTDSPGGEYSNQSNLSLTSPVIDITDADSIEVSYMSLCDTEAGYDYGHFEVQYNDGAWQELSQCDGENTWQQETQALSPPLGASELKVRFRLTTDTIVTRDGWYIDDIQVKASGSACGLVNPDIIYAHGFESSN